MCVFFFFFFFFFFLSFFPVQYHRSNFHSEMFHLLTFLKQSCFINASYLASCHFLTKKYCLMIIWLRKPKISSSYVFSCKEKLYFCSGKTKPYYHFHFFFLYTYRGQIVKISTKSYIITITSQRNKYPCKKIEKSGVHKVFCTLKTKIVGTNQNLLSHHINKSVWRII